MAFDVPRLALPFVGFSPTPEFFPQGRGAPWGLNT